MMAGSRRAGVSLLRIPVAGGAVIEAATMVAINEDGYAVAASKSEDITVVGAAQERVDNATGSDGLRWITVDRGAYVWNQDGTIAETDVLKPCYVADTDKVTKTASGSSRAGIILQVEDDGVTVLMDSTKEEA